MRNCRNEKTQDVTRKQWMLIGWSITLLCNGVTFIFEPSPLRQAAFAWMPGNNEQPALQVFSIVWVVAAVGCLYGALKGQGHSRFAWACAGVPLTLWALLWALAVVLAPWTASAVPSVVFLPLVGIYGGLALAAFAMAGMPGEEHPLPLPVLEGDK